MKIYKQAIQPKIFISLGFFCVCFFFVLGLASWLNGHPLNLRILWVTLGFFLFVSCMIKLGRRNREILKVENNKVHLFIDESWVEVKNIRYSDFFRFFEVKTHKGSRTVYLSMDDEAELNSFLSSFKKL